MNNKVLLVRLTGITENAYSSDDYREDIWQLIWELEAVPITETKEDIECLT